jgi:hypothetical protein
MSKGGNNKGNDEIKRSHFLLILFLTFILIFLIFLIIYKKQSVNKSLAICSSDSNKSILIEASKYLNPIQSSKLFDVAQRITKLKNFNKDPNCDYIMLSYNLGYNYTNANYYYNQLNKYYSSKTGYSPIISNKVYSFPELQNRLSQAKSVDNEIKNNTFYVNGATK